MGEAPPAADRVAGRGPSQYILQLREKVGHDLLVLPSVTILLFDDDQRLLLVRHHNRGLWVAPGGMVEPDEDPAVTARREMREETGIEVVLVRMLGVFGGPEFRVRYQNGDEVGYVMAVYEARSSGGRPRPDQVETLDIGFFSREQIETMETASWLPVVLREVTWP
ncbi:MAG TPA: NUDIX domain-containing protein [Longimicrobiales bacterium]|nr:NUDIX domain-containing protein [Longimicrobiales bacterium]